MARRSDGIPTRPFCRVEADIGGTMILWEVGVA